MLFESKWIDLFSSFTENILGHLCRTYQDMIETNMKLNQRLNTSIDDRQKFQTVRFFRIFVSICTWIYSVIVSKNCRWIISQFWSSDANQSNNGFCAICIDHAPLGRRFMSTIRNSPLRISSHFTVWLFSSSSSVSRKPMRLFVELWQITKRNKCTVFIEKISPEAIQFFDSFYFINNLDLCRNTLIIIIVVFSKQKKIQSINRWKRSRVVSVILWRNGSTVHWRFTSKRRIESRG